MSGSSGAGSNGPSPDAGPPSLTGGRCQACGRTFFPWGEACVACGSPGPDRIPLPPSGRVIARTRIADRWVVEIELKGGPLLMGWIDGAETLGIGDRVRYAPIDRTMRFTRDER